MISSFSANVLQNKYLTPDVILLSLKIPEDFSFQAGQFITIMIENSGEQKSRSYSILSPPSQKNQLDLCIKIVSDGFASEVFTKTKMGDSFALKGPFGHFIFDQETTNDHVFLGAGTGVAPLYCMIKEHLLNSSKQFTLISGTKTQQDLLFNQDFLDLQKTSKNFTYVPVLSREPWDGQKGHVQDHLPADLQNKTFYICGLKELVLESKELLLSKGVKPENIKFERYT
jgi:glycine betaine catabolism B